MKKLTAALLSLLIAGITLIGTPLAAIAQTTQTVEIAYSTIGIYPRQDTSMSAKKAETALADGATINAVCEIKGETVTDTHTSSNMWIKLDSGYYVPSIYTAYAYSSPNSTMPDCETGILHGSTYNASAAIKWALDNAYSTPRFDEDCTWFISQALWQGGIPKSDEWNDHSSDPKKTHRKHNPGPTAPARLAGELFWYLMRTNQVSLKKIDWNDNTASGAKLGDLIFYNLDGDENNTMDHVAIVTSLNDQGYPFVTQHTSAARDKYWSWSLSHSNWVASAYPGSSAYLVRFK